MTSKEKQSDPTKEPEFQRVLKNLLSTPHKPQKELKRSAIKAKPRIKRGRKPGTESAST